MARYPPTFALESLMLVIALAAACMAVVRVTPFLGVLLSAVSTASLTRTYVQVATIRSEGRRVSPFDKGIQSRRLGPDPAPTLLGLDPAYGTTATRPTTTSSLRTPIAAKTGAWCSGAPGRPGAGTPPARTFCMSMATCVSSSRRLP